MGEHRIKRSEPALAIQVRQASKGVADVGGSWPASGPTDAELLAMANDLDAASLEYNQTRSAWLIAAQIRRRIEKDARDLMRRVDEATDLLYTPSGSQKLNFGLPPKGSPLPPIEKLISLRTGDGNLPGSVTLRWERIDGCVYEVQWALDESFENVVGFAASTRCRYMVEGMTPGQIVFMRVRPIRGGKIAPWSGTERRIAPL